MTSGLETRNGLQLPVLADFNDDDFAVVVGQDGLLGRAPGERVRNGGLRGELASSAGGAALVHFVAAGAGSAAQTALTKMRQTRHSSDKTGNLNAQLDSWKADFGANAGGRIAVPSGSHVMTSGFIADSGYDIQGDGRLRSILNPNFAGTMFKFDAGISSTAYHNRVSGFGVYTAHAGPHTLFHNRNGANVEICRISMAQGAVPGATSIGYLHEGREITWLHDNIWAAGKCMRIVPNTDPVALNITTDYLSCEREHYIADVATEANVESTGAYISSASWRDCALVRGAEGIKLVNAGLAVASHNVSINGCRAEQKETAAAFSFHFEFTAATLHNLTFGNNYTAAAQNGFYGRGIERAFLHSSVFTQGVGRTALDVALPTNGSLTLLECLGQVSGAKNIAGGHPIIVVPSRTSNMEIGSFEHHVGFVTPADPGAGGTINFDNVPVLEFGGIQTSSFQTVAPTGSRYIRMPLVPVNVAGGGVVDAILEARGDNSFIRVRYPKGGGAPVVEGTPSGIFAATATANKIYPYANGLISDSLTVAQTIRVDVRQ